MTYQFNLHKHIKIWLSKNPGLFINLENADRLIKMRDINPNDEINFVYDSKLLNEEAKTNLKLFCEQYRINPIDVRTDVFPYLQSELEKELFEFYNQEIASINKYGNPALASDILRWLTLSFGSYTDCDVYVDTSTLSQTIKAEVPLLFNIGSIIYSSDYLHSICIKNNTDIILVADYDTAKPQIEIFQKTLLHSLKHGFLAKEKEEEFKSPLFDFLKPYLLDLNPIKSKEYIIKLTENNRSLILGLGGALDKIDEFLFNISLKFPHLHPVFTKSLLQKPIAERQKLTLTEIRKRAREELLLKYICNVSGPNLILNALENIPPSPFFHSLNEEIEYSEKKLPFSFEVYSLYDKKLNNAFVSLNGVPLNSLPDSIEVERLEQAAIGECSDLSWLEKGQESQTKREDILAKTWQITPKLRLTYNFFKEKKVLNFQETQLALYMLILNAEDQDESALATLNSLLGSTIPDLRIMIIKEANSPSWRSVQKERAIEFESLLHLIAFKGAVNFMKIVLELLPEEDRYRALMEPDVNELQNTVIHTALNSPLCSLKMLDLIASLIPEQACLDIVTLLEQENYPSTIIDKFLCQLPSACLSTTI